MDDQELDRVKQAVADAVIDSLHQYVKALSIRHRALEVYCLGLTIMVIVDMLWRQ